MASDEESSSWGDNPADTAAEKTGGKKPSGGDAKASKKKASRSALATSSAEILNLTATTDIKNDELTCSRCLWSARALRAALKDKMPKRLKEASKRRAAAEEALDPLEDSGKAAACHESRFPSRISKKQVGKTMRIYYADADAPKDESSRYQEAESGMDAALGELRDACKLLLQELN